MSRSLKVVSAGLSVLFSPLVMALNPFVVKDIRVEGMLRTDAGTVFNYLPIKVGDKVDDQAVSRAIKSLFSTGFFRDVRIETDKDVLVVIVDERPAIARIEFSGNDEFDSKILLKGLKDIGISEAQTFDRSQLEKAEQEIKRIYLAKSYYAASIKTTVSPMERNRVAINFEINEGNEAKIKSIRVFGTKAFSESKILELMTLEKIGRWYNLFSEDSYSKQKLQGDIEEIKSWYLDRGYINFRVDSSQVSITPDKKDVYISLSVSEGDLFRVSSVRLAGELPVPEKDLRKIVDIKRGEVYSRARINEISLKLSDRFGNDGYAFANVNVVPEIDEKKKEVALTFFVDPGRRVYVNRINILGNLRTRDEVIRRELLQFENAWFDRKLIEESKKRIERTGFFNEANIETVPVPGNQDLVDLNVTVEERATNTINAGIGYSQTEKFVISGTLSFNNIWGTGNAFSMVGSRGDMSQSYTVSLSEPYWTKDGVSRSFDLYNRRVDSRSTEVSGYISKSTGLGVNFGVPVSLNDTIQLGLSYDRTRTEIFDESPQRYKDFVERFGPSNSSVIASLGWSSDSRNSALTPTSGTLQRVNGEVAVAPGNMRYSRASYSLQHYIPLWTGYSLMFNTELGSVQAYGGKEVPFYKYYYAGGIGSIRGFKEGSLGARVYNARGEQTDEVIGGTRRVRGGMELFFPLPGTKVKTSAFRMSLFLDAVSIWGGASEYEKKTSPSDIRCSTGISVSWSSPIGPLAMSYSIPLVKKSGDKTQPLQFQIGTTF